MKLPDAEFLRKRAREMRRKPTKAEAALWRLLSKDVEWSRQIPLLGMYIADFIHDSLGLVVEADGGYHDDPIQAAKDASRDRVMASMQYDCIRFTNKQILTQPRWVMAAIAARLNVRRKLKGLPIVPYRPGPEPVIPVGRSRRGTYRDFGARKYD